MEDNNIHPDRSEGISPTYPPYREGLTSDEYFAPLEREIEELVQLVDKNSKLLGLPPVEYPD